MTRNDKGVDDLNKDAFIFSSLQQDGAFLIGVKDYSHYYSL